MDIRIDILQKTYGRVTALDVDSLEITSAESFGLVGNNGAGKTTFLRLVLDLIEATQGRVYLDETCVATSEAWKTRTASYLDEGFLIDFLTPLEYVDLVGGFYGMDVDEAMLAPFRGFLEEQALDGSAYIRALSAGNRKKVGLVAALLVEPDLLVLDEPFANLDPTSQHRLKGYLRALHARGTTLILSSHNLQHVTDVCDRIALLEEGRIILDTERAAGTLDELEAYFADRVDEPAPYA